MIGVIDSGSGGINIILECMKYYNQDFVFLLDNKNCPYGDKSKNELINITLNNIKYLIKNYDIDFIILGCNTISSLLDVSYLEDVKIPILKTVPNMQALTKGKNNILFATNNTIKYSKYVRFYLLNYKNITTVSIKNLPKLIDENLSKNTPNTQNILKNALKNAFFTDFFKKNKLKSKYKKAKNISLGCTHFKHIQKELNQLFNKKIKFAYCENEVAKNSKFLIRKNKEKSTIKFILTKPDNTLEYSLNKLFALNNSKIEIS